jgi:hypothetical protein
MAQDLTNKRRDFASACVNYAAKAISLTRDVAELVSLYTDNGFNPGGTNPFQQTDLDNSANAHLTPAIIDAFVTAISNVNLNAGQRTTMRKVASVVIPPPS